MHKCHEKSNILSYFFFWQAIQEYVTYADLRVYNSLLVDMQCTKLN